MSNPVYVTGRNVALRMIKQYGQAVTLRRRDSSIDFETGKPSSDSVVEYGGHAIVSEYSLREIGEIASVKVGDKKLLLVGTPRPKSETDQVRIAEKEYQIIHVNVVSPAGEDVLYEVTVR